MCIASAYLAFSKEIAPSNYMLLIFGQDCGLSEDILLKDGNPIARTYRTPVVRWTLPGDISA